MATRRNWTEPETERLRALARENLSTCAIGRLMGRHEEVVHHKPGFRKDDNRYPETLELYRNNGDHLRKELMGRVPKWTPQGKANLQTAARLKHERAQRPPKPPFDRQAWASTRPRNANGEFAP